MMSTDEQPQSAREFSDCATFIADRFPEVGARFHSAEMALHEIPKHALTELRACGKMIATGIAAKNGLERDDQGNFYDLISGEGFERSTSKQLRDDLHKLRMDGNRAVHPEDDEALEREEAFKLASAGLANAYNIVCRYLTSDGDDAPEFELPHESRSNRLCGDAVLRGDADAQFRLGMLKKSMAEAEYEAQSEAALDAGGAIFGDIEMTRQFEEAYYWFERAAWDGRYPKGLYEMAQLHIDRRISGHDLDRGLALLYQAEENGVVDAAARLGLFGLSGEVVTSRGQVRREFEDTTHTKEWLEYAASHGHPDALNGLVGFYLAGPDADKNYERILQYAREAVDRGSSLAKANLARLYLADIGEPRDEEKIATLFEEAAEDGVREAYAYLSYVYDEGVGVTRDSHRAREALERGCEEREPYALVMWAEKSIEGDGPGRELRRELYSLLRVIDDAAAPEKLREDAAELQDDTVETMTERLRLGLQQAGNLSESEQIHHYLMDLGVAAADVDLESDVDRTYGFAKDRAEVGMSVPASFVLLVAAESSPADRRAAARALEALIPGIDWVSLIPESIDEDVNRVSTYGESEDQKPFRREAPEIGRNEQCPCGSGRKFKRCCLRGS